MTDTLIGNLQVDPPIQLTAIFRYDIPDRRYLDRQILGAQQHLVDSLLSSAVCSWYQVDTGSATLVIGDIVTLAGGASNKLVTKATPSALVAGGKALGIVMNPAGPGVNVRVALWGTVGKSITGLVASANRLVRVSSAARCESVVSYAGGDYPIGICDVAGNLAIEGMPVFGFGTGLVPGTVGQVFVTIGGPATTWVTPGGDLVGPMVTNAVVALTGAGGIVDAKKTLVSWTQDNGADNSYYPMRFVPTEAGATIPTFWFGNAAFTNPIGTRLNHVFGFGWNLNAGGGPAIAGECSMGLGFESHFNPGSGPYMEHHTYAITPAGAQRRPMTWTLNKSTGEVQGVMSGDRLTYQLDAGGVPSMVIQHGVSPVTIGYGSFGVLGVVLRNESNNVGFLQQRNAANSAYIEIARVNGSNQVMLANGGDATNVGGSLSVAGLAAGGFVSAVATTGLLTVSATIPAGGVAPGTNGQAFVTAAGASGWATPGPDWTGPVATNAVVQLTGAAGSVSIPTGTKLAWASSGPSLEYNGGDFLVRLNTASKSFTIYDTATLALLFNYNAGNPFLQFGGGGMNIQATSTQYLALSAAASGDVRVFADFFNVYPSAGGTAKGNWTNTGLRIGDGAAATEKLDVLGNATVSGSVTANGAGTTAVLRVFTGAGSYAALYMGVTPGAGNYSLISNGSEVILNAPVGGIGFRQAGSASGVWTSVGLRVGDGTVATDQFEQLGNNHSWDKTASGPKIYQKDNTTNSATGSTLTLQAQNATGTTSNGGPLVLQAGSGTTAPGTITLKEGTHPLGVWVWNGGDTYYQVDAGANGLQLLANAGTSQYIKLLVAGTTPTGLQLAADTIDFQTGASAAKGRWNNTGLRVGDATGATDQVELLGANFSWDKTTSSPKIYQKDNTTNSATGQALTLQSQNATGTSTVGGSFTLKSGTGTSVDGAINVQMGAGSNNFLKIASANLTLKHATTMLVQCDSIGFFTTAGGGKGSWNNTGLRIGSNAGATHILEVGGSEIVHEGSFFTFAAAVTGPLFSQAQATSGNGVIMSLKAQSGFGTGNTSGGDVTATGGAGNGTGVGGGVQLKTGADTSGTLASLAVHKVGVGYAAVSLFGLAADADLNHRSNVLWIANIDNIGTLARPNTGTQWFSVTGMPSIFGSNANSKEVNFDNTLGGAIVLGTSTDSLNVHVGGVAFRIPLI